MTVSTSIAFRDTGEGLRHVSLSGRLDIAGTEAIAAELATLCTTAQRGVVLDLTAVSFISSIGIRALVTSAKSREQRGGKLALVVAGDSNIARILETTGVDLIIPMFANAAEADAAVAG
ncbi:MAG: STAS domain-containing protein [Ignavibacteria bacterium]